jgi:hypothetical protein
MLECNVAYVLQPPSFVFDVCKTTLSFLFLINTASFHTYFRNAEKIIPFQYLIDHTLTLQAVNNLGILYIIS